MKSVCIEVGSEQVGRRGTASAGYFGGFVHRRRNSLLLQHIGTGQTGKPATDHGYFSHAVVLARNRSRKYGIMILSTSDGSIAFNQANPRLTEYGYTSIFGWRIHRTICRATIFAG